MTPQEKLAKILRTTPKVILSMEEKMERIVGKKDVLDGVIRENDETIDKKLKKLKLSRNSSAEEIYKALLEKTEHSDQALFKQFKNPEFTTTTGCRTLINAAAELIGKTTGFFLKKEKAEELLRKNPPKNIIRILGYSDIDELLKKEKLLEVFSALRFAEDSKWLNKVFFKPYEHLKKKDFEERKIEVNVLSEKWLKVGKEFIGHKLHHISHLKELGVVFVIPFEDKYPGATIEVFTLVLHYFHEVDFYSKLFQKYSGEENFTKKAISALRGDVGGLPLPDDQIVTWRIIQRYLAKDDFNDARLFEPHVNSEVIFWNKAKENIAKLGDRFPELGLDFWDSLNFESDYFKKKINGEGTLISFGLIDNVISLTRKSNVDSKYIYHHHEALWNRIFEGYIGEKEMEKLVIEHFGEGFISLKS